MNGTLVERVAAEIREAILTGRLRAGEHIAQDTFARRLGTSRLPVREALRELHNEGLVVLRPNAGARVRPLTLGELTEVYLMREGLEPVALAESIPHLSQYTIEQLQAFVEEMERADDESGRGHWLEIDQRFHRLALGGAAMPRLLSVIEALWNVAVRYRRAYTELWFPSHLGIQHAEHRLLMNAIERRDVRDGASLLRMHIRRTRLGLMDRPEAFDD